jgi:uncharacterized membrane protein YphA (DoxX/SURF4 family)
MQRLFSSFPHGLPGVGLLLLRAAVGLALGVQGEACLAGGEPWSWAWMAGLLVIATGASLLIGCLTPVAGSLAGLVSAGLALYRLPPSIPDLLGGEPAKVFMVVMAAAVLLIGPGAFSLDARWFGRREVVIPSDRRVV